MKKAIREISTVTLTVTCEGVVKFEIVCLPSSEAAEFLKMREGAIDEFMKDKGYMIYNDPFSENRLYRKKDLEKIKRQLSRDKRSKFISM